MEKLLCAIAKKCGKRIEVGDICYDIGEDSYCTDCVKQRNAMQQRLRALKLLREYRNEFQRRPSGDCWNDVIEKSKAEAIKEFAERLKEKMKWDVEYENKILIYDEDISALVKEMVGE